MRKVRGFTLIEVIVVIAIIGILAAVLVPSMLGYVKNARIRRYNSNAATVYKGSQLAIIDVVNAKKTVQQNCKFINSVDGSGVCTEVGGSTTLDLTDYIGENFEGYFGFYTNGDGTGSLYAMWSENPITSDMLDDCLNEDEVKALFASGQIPRGCHPLKVTNDDDDDDDN